MFLSYLLQALALLFMAFATLLFYLSLFHGNYGLAAINIALLIVNGTLFFSLFRIRARFR